MQRIPRNNFRQRANISLSCGFCLCLALLLTTIACTEDPEDAICPPVVFLDSTAEAGLVRYSPTFGVAVADLDRDGADDLVVSNHGQIPAIFLNRGGVFEEFSFLLPDPVISDRHGVTAADFDNDGDIDLAIAGGGADGSGPGDTNWFYMNCGNGGGGVDFVNITESIGLSFSAWRTRHFLPLPGDGGRLVDLYMVCLPREGYPNLFLSNIGGGIGFQVNTGTGLNQPFSSHGLDLVFDFDRDGDSDMLLILYGVPVMFERIGAVFHRREDLFPGVFGVYSTAVGDLDNDGDLDVCFGGIQPPSGSDNISYNDSELHFVVRRQADDTFDRLDFTAASPTLSINFLQHTAQGTIRDPGNIYIGGKALNPISRETEISAVEAEGEPPRNRPGIYLWTDHGQIRWHVEWVYGQDDRVDKGKMTASGISAVGQTDWEVYEVSETSDRIWRNDSGTGFTEWETWNHSETTRALAICDLNNDGWLDVAGLRSGEQGDYNGDHFFLINCGGRGFEWQTALQNEEDDIYQSDILVWGFFNGDGLPDLFFTNGFGLNPGSWGPYKLYLNETPDAGHCVILDLEGTSANRDAFGAEIELVTGGGEYMGYRQQGAGFNRAQRTHKIHFGVGERTDSFIARVRWPDQEQWIEYPVAVDQVVKIKQ